MEVDAFTGDGREKKVDVAEDLFNWTTVMGSFRTEYDTEQRQEVQRFRRDRAAHLAIPRVVNYLLEESERDPKLPLRQKMGEWGIAQTKVLPFIAEYFDNRLEDETVGGCLRALVLLTEPPPRSVGIQGSLRLHGQMLALKRHLSGDEDEVVLRALMGRVARALSRSVKRNVGESREVQFVLYLVSNLLAVGALPDLPPKEQRNRAAETTRARGFPRGAGGSGGGLPPHVGAAEEARRLGTFDDPHRFILALDRAGFFEVPVTLAQILEEGGNTVMIGGIVRLLAILSRHFPADLVVHESLDSEEEEEKKKKGSEGAVVPVREENDPLHRVRTRFPKHSLSRHSRFGTMLARERADAPLERARERELRKARTQAQVLGSSPMGVMGEGGLSQGGGGTPGDANPRNLEGGNLEGEAGAGVGVGAGNANKKERKKGSSGLSNAAMVARKSGAVAARGAVHVVSGPREEVYRVGRTRAPPGRRNGMVGASVGGSAATGSAPPSGAGVTRMMLRASPTARRAMTVVRDVFRRLIASGAMTSLLVGAKQIVTRGGSATWDQASTDVLDLSSFIMAMQRAEHERDRRNAKKPHTAPSSSTSTSSHFHVTGLACALDSFNRHLALSGAREAQDSKQWDALRAPVRYMCELAGLLDELNGSPVQGTRDLGESLAHDLFYQADTQELIPRLLEQYQPGRYSRSCLFDLIEAAHVLVKIGSSLAERGLIVRAKSRRKAARTAEGVAAERAEKAFHFASWFQSFLHPRTMQAYADALSSYASNGPRVNHYVFSFLRRVADTPLPHLQRDEDGPFPKTWMPFLWHAEFLAVFRWILTDRGQFSRDSRLAPLAREVTQRFFRAANEAPVLVADALFWHSRQVVQLIGCGYDPEVYELSRQGEVGLASRNSRAAQARAAAFDEAERNRADSDDEDDQNSDQDVFGQTYADEEEEGEWDEVAAAAAAAKVLREVRTKVTVRTVHEPVSDDQLEEDCGTSGIWDDSADAALRREIESGPYREEEGGSLADASFEAIALTAEPFVSLPELRGNGSRLRARAALLGLVPRPTVARRIESTQQVVTRKHTGRGNTQKETAHEPPTSLTQAAVLAASEAFLRTFRFLEEEYFVEGDDKETTSRKEYFVEGDDKETTGQKENFVEGDDKETTSQKENFVEGDDKETTSQKENFVEGDDKETTSRKENFVEGDDKETTSQRESKPPGENAMRWIVELLEDAIEAYKRAAEDAKASALALAEELGLSVEELPPPVEEDDEDPALIVPDSAEKRSWLGITSFRSLLKVVGARAPTMGEIFWRFSASPSTLRAAANGLRKALGDKETIEEPSIVAVAAPTKKSKVSSKPAAPVADEAMQALLEITQKTSEEEEEEVGMESLEAAVFGNDFLGEEDGEEILESAGSKRERSIDFEEEEPEAKKQK